MDRTAYDMVSDSVKDKWCSHIKCSELKGFWCSLQSEFSGRIPCSLIQSYTCPVAREHEKEFLSADTLEDIALKSISGKRDHLTEHQFHVVWTEAVGKEGYNKKLFQMILKDLKKQGLVIS